MTKLQMLTQLLAEVADSIATTDREESNDDTECGVIEGKLAAYKDVAGMLAEKIKEAV